jgi:NAD(P)H-dependent FMN reductase
LLKILALSGSLRAASINSALLRACARLAPAGTLITVYPSLGVLPLFNPDLESPIPAAVSDLHRAVRDTDALLIASPEYAHGVSGTIKNALDWLVSYEPFVGKHAAVLNASPRASIAYQALQETLRTMSAIIVPQACVSVALLGAHLSEDDLVADRQIAAVVRQSITALAAATRRQRSPSASSFPVETS